ncbi:MAG: cbb3-type cytochrome oxidase assembly protein CcoS [Oceanospirillaceae bacterium]|nr:cbb3-type cytochrome oxidase assembly protein CcoS [Oceanospirillaceae bacterium]|tara:strand:+ start:955 stop:1155 length:201 start_codon:yes stop_codon:yes gene_type:complete
MDIIYVLIPLSILLISIAVLVFFWAVKGGQFDDLDSPAHRILFDDDDEPQPAPEQTKPADKKSSDD